MSLIKGEWEIPVFWRISKCELCLWEVWRSPGGAVPWVGVLEDRAAAFDNESHAKLPPSRLCLPQGESGSCWHENCIDLSMYPLESSRTCTGPWAKLSYGEARRSRLTVLLHPWLVYGQLGMQGRHRPCHPSVQRVCLYLGKCWASLSRGCSTS